LQVDEGHRAGRPDPEGLDEVPGAGLFPGRDDLGLPPPERERLSLPEIVEGQRADRMPVVWGSVPARNPVFTGREELLERLDHRLRAQNAAAVLHGEGGVGTSEIAVEYAYRHRGDYEVIWWIPAQRPAEILASLIELGHRLGLDVGGEVVTAVGEVRAALSAGTPYRNWLLVFDDAESPETVRRCFPAIGAGKILVTSRNQWWSGMAESLEVDVFTRAESVRLLRRRNQNLLEAEADLLAGTLGDLPPAIAHASAWLHTTAMAAGEYLRLIEDERAGRPGDEMPVATVVGIALDRLATENPAARQLLQICSFFAPEPIDRGLFVAVSPTVGAPELDEVLRNPSRLNQAVRDIQRYGLARIDNRRNSLQLHRLVRVVLQDGIPSERRRVLEHGAHLLLAGARLGDPADPDQWPSYQALAGHLIAADAVACEDPWTRDVMIRLLRFQLSWDPDGGLALSRRVVDDWRERLGADHPQTLTAEKLLGHYLWSAGNFREAETVLRRTLQRCRATMGGADEGTIEAMSMVATTIRGSGGFAADRDLDLDAFRLARGHLGGDDPATLRVAHQLATGLRLTGDFPSARALDADTYRRRIHVLGHDHPETLRTLNSLTVDQRESGEFFRSRQLAEQTYARYLVLFGVAHRETIRVARDLAVARRRAGDHDDARKLAEDTMYRFRDRFGPVHPDTLAAALGLAVDLRERDDLVRALDLAAETVRGYGEALGPAHPYTSNARTTLGVVLRLSGRVEEAREHDRAAGETVERTLGPAHPLTLTCGINQASDLDAAGAHQAAYDLDSDLLDRCRRRMGERHPLTLVCALNLSFDLTALGRGADARRGYDDALAAYVRVFGAAHPAVTAARAHRRAGWDVDPMPF
jgi:tetratricopeptide repeat protein